MQNDTSVISAEEPSAEAVITQSSIAETKPIRVLLIEDNPGDVQLIQMMLSDAGGELFDVEVVERLEAGLKRLAQGGIGVVLSDLSLPDSFGLDTFTKLHGRAPQVPIIVL